jgi:hypothetical protein
MRSLLVVVGLCTLVHAQTFKSTLDQVAVSVTIHSDPTERVADLRAEDFRVFDNGRQVPIVTFGKLRQSVHVLLLLDTSRSMAESLLDVKTAATAIVERLAPGDSVQVGTFSKQGYVVLGYQGTVATLEAEQALLDRLPAREPTPLIWRPSAKATLKKLLNAGEVGRLGQGRKGEQIMTFRNRSRHRHERRARRGRTPARRRAVPASRFTTCAGRRADLRAGGRARSVAMSIVGHKTESIYRPSWTKPCSGKLPLVWMSGPRRRNRRST